MGEAVQELTALEMQVRGEQRQNCSLQGDFTARFWAAEERGAGGCFALFWGVKQGKGMGHGHWLCHCSSCTQRFPGSSSGYAGVSPALLGCWTPLFGLEAQIWGLLCVAVPLRAHQPHVSNLMF